MQLVKTKDPQKQGIKLEPMPMEDYETGDWEFKSYYGSNDGWYERGTHTKDGRVRWFRLVEDD